MRNLEKLRTEQNQLKNQLNETIDTITNTENRAEALNNEMLSIENQLDSIGVQVARGEKSEEDCLKLHRRLLDCRALYNVFLRAAGSLEEKRKELLKQISRLSPGIRRAEDRIKYDECLTELLKNYDKDKLETELRDLRVAAGVDVHQYRQNKQSVLQEHGLDPMEKFFKRIRTQKVA